GASGMGYLVDVGYAPDVHSGAVADLRELSDIATFFHERADAHDGGCVGDLWGAGRAARLLLDLVFPNAASATRRWRRRIDRSAHVARVANQLARVYLFCVSGVLVALPVGEAAARSGRSAECRGPLGSGE